MNRTENHSAKALYEEGAWLEPLVGKQAFRSRKVPGAKPGDHWSKRYTRASITEVLSGEDVGIMPASMGYVVLDVDDLSMQDEVEQVLAAAGVDYGRAQSASGKYHVMVAWDDADGEWLNGKLTLDGHEFGDVRYAGSVCLIADWDAWLETELHPNKAKKTIDALGYFGARLKGHTPEAIVSRVGKTDFECEIEPLIADCLKPQYTIDPNGRTDSLYRACLNQPLLADHYADEGRKAGLSEREIAHNVANGVQHGTDRGNHLLRHANRPWNPIATALATAQCPLPVGIQGRQWHRWTKSGWEECDTHEIIAWLRMWYFELYDHGMLEPISDGARKVNPATILGNYTTLLRALAHDRTIVANDEPDMVGLPNRQKLNVITGEVSTAQYHDYFTKQIATAPAPGPHPLWDNLLSGLSDEQREWTRSYIKYCLHGTVSYQYFLFAQGPPGTGKSTFAKAVMHLLGDYGTASAARNFTKANLGAHTTWLVPLTQSRLAVVEEMQPGDFSPILKSIASGDRISGRGMQQDETVLVPRCKLIMTANQRPTFPPGDGIKRRMALLEFAKKPAVPDPFIDDKIAAELPQILHWALGATVPIAPLPEAMIEAADEYESDLDYIGAAIEEYLEPGTNWLPLDEIRKDLPSYMGTDKEYGISTIRDHLKRSGFTVGKTSRGQRKNVPAVKAKWVGSVASPDINELVG